jgi:hypothetical protein
MGKLEAFASMAPKPAPSGLAKVPLPEFDYAAHNHSETTPCVKYCPAFTEAAGT